MRTCHTLSLPWQGEGQGEGVRGEGVKPRTIRQLWQTCAAGCLGARATSRVSVCSGRCVRTRRGRTQLASSTARATAPVGPRHVCHGAAIGPASRTAAWGAVLALAAFARRHRHSRHRHPRHPRHPVDPMAASLFTRPALMHRKLVVPRTTAATRELVTSSPCANQGRPSAVTRMIGFVPVGKSRHRRHHRRGLLAIRRSHRQRPHLPSRVRSVPGSSSPASSSSAAR